MTVLAIAARAPWPRNPAQILHLAVAGIGIQAVYLGGVWVAVKHGMPAGMAALIVNLQPVLTAVAGPLIGERVRPVQWAGLLLGFVGVAMVVWVKVGSATLAAGPVLLALMSLLAITAGTLYQKRFVPTFDLRTGQVVQFAASIAVTLPLALAFEFAARTLRGWLIDSAGRRADAEISTALFSRVLSMRLDGKPVHVVPPGVSPPVFPGSPSP